MTSATETQYGIRRAEQREMLPEIDLIIVPHKGVDLHAHVFGSNNYSNNLSAMQKAYFHSGEFSNVSFRPAVTSESVSIAHYEFNSKGEVDAKRGIFDPRWLQAGRIVRWKDGVYTNTEVTDKEALKEMLNGAREVNGIYLINDMVAFAPYESFEQKVYRDVDEFAESGLARALEHTEEKIAKNLREIASPENYKRGVNVFGFDSVEEPISRVACLYSYWGVGDGRLGVVGYWGGCGGFAFGVLE